MRALPSVLFIVLVLLVVSPYSASVRTADMGRTTLLSLSQASKWMQSDYIPHDPMLQISLPLSAPLPTGFSPDSTDSSFVVADTLQTSSDEILWETVGGPDTLDPHVDHESFGNWVSQNVYETLYTYPLDSSDARPTAPLLAEDLAVSDGGTAYTLTLREGITFHDGTPFNASCVKYNLERAVAMDDGEGPASMIMDPLLGSAAIREAIDFYGAGSTEHEVAYNTWLTQGTISVLSTYIVQIKLESPHAPFLAALTYCVGSMISPSYVEAHGGVVVGEKNGWMESHTCGTGPYMVTSWDRLGKIELELNTEYWRTTQARNLFPNAGSISRVTIMTNEDQYARIDHLEGGLIDGCDWPIIEADRVYNRVNGLSGDGTAKSSNANLKVWCGEPAFGISVIGFNMKPEIRQSDVPTQNPFTIKAMREAVSYAFDYETYLSSVYNGIAVRANGPVPTGMWGHDDNLPLCEYDLTSAVTCWNQAMTEGLDAILANMSYELSIFYYPGWSTHEGCAQLIRDGINAILTDPRAVQPSESLAVTAENIDSSVYSSLLEDGELSLFMSGWRVDYADPHNFVIPFVKSIGFYANCIGLADSTGWNASTVDDWIDSAASSQDPLTRLALYKGIQEAIVDHYAYVWRSQGCNFHVERAEMNGYVYNPMRQPYFFHYHKTVSTATPAFDPMILVGNIGALCALVILGSFWRKRRRRIVEPYEVTPMIEPAAVADAVREPAVTEPVEPPPIAQLPREEGVYALRGCEAVGGKFEYKVKVQNDTDYVINNVTVMIVGYPEDCLEISGSNAKTISRIEPSGFRSPHFIFSPTKDCVQGQILTTVSYLDHQNKVQIIEVEPYLIRSVCDLLKPLGSSIDEFEHVLTDMECTSQESHINWNGQVLFDKAKALLPTKNFQIIDQSGQTIAGEFTGTIRGFAKGKYTGKRVAVQLLISGPADGEYARVVLEGLGDDMAMIPTTIDEIASGIESWICLYCGGALLPREVIQLKDGLATQCKYCGRTLTDDLYRK